jgi:hypothetical protein
MDHEPLDLRDLVARRYAFDEWRRRTTAPDLIFVWNLTLRGNELPEMRAERIEWTDLRPVYERMAAPAGEETAPRAGQEIARLRALDTMTVAHVHTIWRHTQRRDVLLRVDVFESASLEDAHDMMVWLLGECESPLIEHKEGVGDVGFGERGNRVLMFCRANLVYLLRNIGHRVEPVMPVATALDAHAISHPETAAVAVPRTERSAHGSGADVRGADDSGADDSSTVEATLYDIRADPEARRRARKFFAREGHIRMSGGRITYRGPRAGLDGLATYDMPGGEMPRRR